MHPLLILLAAALGFYVGYRFGESQGGSPVLYGALGALLMPILVYIILFILKIIILVVIIFIALALLVGILRILGGARPQ